MPYLSSGQSQYNEVKSHSSLLFNDRLNLWLGMLDYNSIEMNRDRNLNNLFGVWSVLNQIWVDVRPLVYNNPNCRRILNLELDSAPGVYVIDVALGEIEMSLFKAKYAKHGLDPYLGFMLGRQLRETNIIVNNILQFFSYFIRPDYKQKPDILTASKQYKQNFDKMTLEQIYDIAGVKIPPMQQSASDDQETAFIDDQEEEGEEEDSNNEEENA